MWYKVNDLERPPRSRGISKYKEVFDMIDKLKKADDEISLGFDDADEMRKAALSIRRHVYQNYPKKTFSVSSREELKNIWIILRVDLTKNTTTKPKTSKSKAKK